MLAKAALSNAGVTGSSETGVWRMFIEMDRRAKVTGVCLRGARERSNRR